VLAETIIDGRGKAATREIPTPMPALEIPCRRCYGHGRKEIIRRESTKHYAICKLCGFVVKPVGR
jgi:hypothetical protein